jgi:hypothetical protein
MMPERKVVQDGSIEGYVCNSWTRADLDRVLATPTSGSADPFRGQTEFPRMGVAYTLAPDRRQSISSLGT